MKTYASKSLARFCLAACLCFLVLAQPSLSLAGGCSNGYCYRAPVRYSYPVYYPVVQKVVEQQIVQVPQVYYQVASELRDKAIAQLTANSLLPIIGQRVQQAVKQELQGAIQGRICLELGASAGTGVSTGGGIGNYPAPGPGPAPGPSPHPGPGSPLPPRGDLLTQAQAIFTQYCVECHNPQMKKGGIDYTNLTRLDISTVTRGIHLADIGEMPPRSQGKQPVPDDVMQFLKQFEYQITSPPGSSGQQGQQAQAPQTPHPTNGQNGSQQPLQGPQQLPPAQQPLPPSNGSQPPAEQPNSPPAPQPPAEQPPAQDNPPQAGANPAPTKQASFILRTTTNYEPIKILKRPRLRP